MIEIIIPTKGKLDYLFKCLDRIKIHTTVPYQVNVADTGSTSEELGEIKKFLKFHFKKYKNANLFVYDYYNFAAINNDVVRNTNGSRLVFCNNDVFLENDCIGRMNHVMETYKDSDIRVGTVGCRLLYPDGLVQHAGQFAFVRNNGTLEVTHRGIGQKENYPSLDPVMGNTGALMMSERKTFEEIGCFNENYTECFEDVEYNMKCLLDGYINFYLDDAEAIHAESATRTKSWEALRKVTYDYDNTLRPYWRSLSPEQQAKILGYPR